jgi:adenine-specific DNA-methyltransferase
MAKKRTMKKAARQVATLTHDEAKRFNIPTAEFQSVLSKGDQKPVRVAYPRASGRDAADPAGPPPDAPLADERAARNRDLDPQLVWRGKDEQDWSDLVVHAPPLFIQEKVHPKALVDDLLRRTRDRRAEEAEHAAPSLFPDLYKDFNGLPEGATAEFYRHEANWTNRMILGDSLQVMASLAEREGLRGKVQCIYLDPPYGIKFNSNFQWSTTSRDVKDGKTDHITREPEQVKAFRDTWRDGIHSYLTYLRDRLTVARDLLHESGSIFVQIGDENVHRVRAVMDEVFGERMLISQIAFRTTTGRAGASLAAASNYILWYSKSESFKYRDLFTDKMDASSTGDVYTRIRNTRTNHYRKSTDKESIDITNIPDGYHLFRPDNLTSSRPAGDGDVRRFSTQGRSFTPGKGTFKTNEVGLIRLNRSNRLWPTSRGTLQYVRHFDDFPVVPIANMWTDTGTGSFTDDKVYVVQTGSKVIERCLLMATDPGDLVLDPTCGSGTTGYVAEQWGRRWITIDTSRVSLALARARIMGARYPFYLLADSLEGQVKEAEVTRTEPSTAPTRGNIRHGFVYERVPHVTLKSIANNAEIDVIWEKFQARLEPLREKLNSAAKQNWEEWEIPREADDDWPREAKDAHTQWWEQRIARQREIDASIAAKADHEHLYDKPYEDRKKVRVAGPFTVESISPHRTLGVDEDDELIDPARSRGRAEDEQGFVTVILENLKAAGVQQAHKEDRIEFSSLAPWPGRFIGAEGRYTEGGAEDGADGVAEKRAGIFIGPEFGTVSRQDLVAAAREAGDADFDVLIACAFNYEAHASEFSKLGRIPVLKARMNAELHMAEDLKNTGKGNLFVIFGEPDIDILDDEGGQIRVKINGVDVFHPQTGEVRSDDSSGIACWFIDTDYNEESFFVRQAYFLGASDPYKSLKTTLKAEIDEEAWETLHSDTSRPFPKPEGGRIAVKVINHLGDEVMKVFRVE